MDHRGCNAIVYEVSSHPHKGCEMRQKSGLRIRFETGFHGTFNGTIDVSGTWKEPLIVIITLIAVLGDGERPSVHLAGVFQPTDGISVSIIFSVEIKKPTSVTRDVTAIGVAYL